MSGVISVAVSPSGWRKTIIRLVLQKVYVELKIPSAVSSCSTPSLCSSEVPSSMATSAALALFSWCECSISVPEVIGSDKATFASSAIMERKRRVTMEMVGENSLRVPVNTRFLNTK